MLISLGPWIKAIVQADRLILMVREESDSESVLLQLERHIDDWISSCDTDASSSFAPTTATSAATTTSNSNYTSDSSNNDSTGHAYRESTTPITFDMRAYEALFYVMLLLQKRQFQEASDHSQALIQTITDHALVSVRLQEMMLNTKDNMNLLLNQTQACVKLLRRLLDEEQLGFLNLTQLKKQPRLYQISTVEAENQLFSKHFDVQSVFESLFIDFQSLQNQVKSLIHRLDNAERSLDLRLDNSRNELMSVSILIGIFGCSIGYAAYIAGIFGMNLDNTQFLQSVEGVFWGVFASTGLLILLSAVVVYFLLKMVKVIPTRASMRNYRKIAGLDAKKEL